MTLTERIIQADSRFVVTTACNQDFESVAAELKARTDSVVKTIDGALAEDKNAFFDQSAPELGFPSYFGRNWDAFEECLNDLQWQQDRGLYILIANADQLLSPFEADLRTFLGIMAAAFDPAASDEREGVGAALTVVLQVADSDAALVAMGRREARRNSVTLTEV